MQMHLNMSRSHLFIWCGACSHVVEIMDETCKLPQAQGRNKKTVGYRRSVQVCRGVQWREQERAEQERVQHGLESNRKEMNDQDTRTRHIVIVAYERLKTSLLHHTVSVCTREAEWGKCEEDWQLFYPALELQLNLDIRDALRRLVDVPLENYEYAHRFNNSRDEEYGGYNGGYTDSPCYDSDHGGGDEDDDDDDTKAEARRLQALAEQEAELKAEKAKIQKKARQDAYFRAVRGHRLDMAIISCVRSTLARELPLAERPLTISAPHWRHQFCDRKSSSRIDLRPLEINVCGSTPDPPILPNTVVEIICTYIHTPLAENGFTRMNYCYDFAHILREFLALHESATRAITLESRLCRQ